MKNEPLKNEARTWLSCIRARIAIKQDEKRMRILHRHRLREQERRAAGIFTAEEQRTNREIGMDNELSSHPDD